MLTLYLTGTCFIKPNMLKDIVPSRGILIQKTESERRNEIQQGMFLLHFTKSANHLDANEDIVHTLISMANSKLVFIQLSREESDILENGFH